jgi:hypothetical protein
MCANTYEFVDREHGRVVRVFSVERLEPGDTTQMALEYVPRHRNSYDVLFVNLKFPLPGSGPNLAEPIGGTLTYRPECLWSEGGTTYAATPPVSGHIEVNIYLQSEGSSGEPMVTLRQVASAVASLDREQPGCLQHARGEYLAPDGTVREALEVCWERIVGGKFPYPDPPPLDFPLTFPVAAYPWHPSPSEHGVQYKSFVSVNATGPFVKLVRLDEGAELGSVSLDEHRLVAVLAGRVRYESESLSDLNVLFGSPGTVLAQMVAEEPTLLWVVQWRPKDDPLSSKWTN